MSELLEAAGRWGTEVQEAFELACSLARDAGRLVVARSRDRFAVHKKGRVNLVTEVDLASERLITEAVQRHFPGHQILAEEAGFSGGVGDLLWIVDPLDGTTNFAHGYPFFCVSIALASSRSGANPEILAGVVYNPLLEELFAAVRGGGAFLNGGRISVSAEDRLEDSLLCTGFSYQFDEIVRNLEFFNRVMREARSVRRDGSAALDLCYVACGRFDGFWEISLNPWDVAAGALLVEEAGGRVSLFDGRPGGVFERECLATNGRIHEALSRILCGEERGGG
ncbi:MAG: inositol monophosphatase family protein [Acidobacteriota bacterium]